MSDRIFTEEEAEAYIDQQVAAGLEQLKKQRGSSTPDDLATLRDEVAGLRADLQSERDKAAAAADARTLAREKIEKMTPEEINARWDEVQVVLQQKPQFGPELTAEKLASMDVRDVMKIPEEKLNELLTRDL